MRKKLSAVLLTLCMTMMSVSMVFAGTYDTDGTANALVTAEVGSSYSIVLPATINLTDPDSDDVYTGDYEIGAQGNLNVAKKIACAPTSSTFTMTGNNHQSVTATVTQSKVEWVNITSPASNQKEITLVRDSGELKDYSVITGSISATIRHAGAYSGNMEFTFGLEDL